MCLDFLFVELLNIYKNGMVWTFNSFACSSRLLALLFIGALDVYFNSFAPYKYLPLKNTNDIKGTYISL